MEGYFLNVPFESFVRFLIEERPNERVFSFEYQGKKYWLKQVEQLTGRFRFLKHHTQKLFQTEIDTLIEYNQLRAPVPKVVLATPNYLVMEDSGKTAKQWFEEDSISKDIKKLILVDIGQSLAKLHQDGFTHGRPALRDISWRDGVVTFIDLEAHQNKTNLDWLKVRDLLIFIHSLYRYLGADAIELIHICVEAYRVEGGESVWLAAQMKLSKFQWLQWALSPIKPFAGKDLRPIYPLLSYFRIH